MNLINIKNILLLNLIQPCRRENLKILDICVCLCVRWLFKYWFQSTKLCTIYPEITVLFNGIKLSKIFFTMQVFLACTGGWIMNWVAFSQFSSLFCTVAFVDMFVAYFAIPGVCLFRIIYLCTKIIHQILLL